MVNAHFTKSGQFVMDCGPVHGTTEMERQAIEAGEIAGWNHANYVNAYGGDLGEPISVPLTYIDYPTYYEAGFMDGIQEYENDHPDDEVGSNDCND